MLYISHTHTHIYISYYIFSADTPFAKVKLGELGAWISRRNFHPLAMAQACGRSKSFFFFY